MFFEEWFGGNHMDQAQFVTLLKKKGTGLTMSKNLSAEELSQLEVLFKSEDVTLTTKATMLTALLMLPSTPEEATWMAKLREQPEAILPEALLFLLSLKAVSPFEHLALKVLGGESLSEADCYEAIDYVFDAAVPNYLKAVFLEAERLKRETEVENKAFLSAFYAKSQHQKCRTSSLIDLSVSYDGLNRTPIFYVFCAPLLASIGYPCVLHGVDEVSPKRGQNTHKLLNLAGKNSVKPLSAVVEDIENAQIGWGYVDQSESFPELFALKSLRQEMVKRPFISTIEKLLRPVYHETAHCLVTSYTHPPYKAMLTAVLSEDPGFHRFLILRGLEGSLQLSLEKRAPWVAYHNGVTETDFVAASEYGFENQILGEQCDLAFSLEQGLSALKNEHGNARDSILYLAMVILDKFGLMRPDVSRSALEESLKSGLALSHWEKGMVHAQT